jgi:hypothetical protein
LNTIIDDKRLAPGHDVVRDQGSLLKEERACIDPALYMKPHIINPLFPEKQSNYRLLRTGKKDGLVLTLPQS